MRPLDHVDVWPDLKFIQSWIMPNIIKHSAVDIKPVGIKLLLWLMRGRWCKIIGTRNPTSGNMAGNKYKTTD